jgi:hypothetical protein
MVKIKWLFLLINLSLTTVLFFIFAPYFTFLHYINTLFYITFAYLLLFLLIYTAKGGFFDGVTFGFRRFKAVMFSNSDYLEDWKTKPLPSEKVNNRFYHILKVQTLLLIGILLVLLVAYFSI